jgi:hypothetical protein
MINEMLMGGGGDENAHLSTEAKQSRGAWEIAELRKRGAKKGVSETEDDPEQDQSLLEMIPTIGSVLGDVTLERIANEPGNYEDFQKKKNC